MSFYDMTTDPAKSQIYKFAKEELEELLRGLIRGETDQYVFSERAQKLSSQIQTAIDALQDENFKALREQIGY